MQKIAEGDHRAFDNLYNRYSTPLLNYFFRMLWKDREKAEDFVHDLFAKIIQNPSSFDTTRTFKTWLYSIANNMCKNEYKKQQVRSGTINGLDTHANVTDNSGNVMHEAHHTLFREEFNQKLNELDEKHREAFTYRHIDGLSIKEIAEILQINEGTIKSRIFYATKYLAKELTHYQSEKSMNHDERYI